MIALILLEMTVLIIILLIIILEIAKMIAIALLWKIDIVIKVIVVGIVLTTIKSN